MRGKVAFCVIPVALAVGCGSSSHPATKTAARPTPAPSVSLTPLAKYRTLEAKYGTRSQGSADDEASAVAANSCDNTLADDKQFVSSIQIAEPDPDQQQQALVDHALLISVWCPSQRLEYDEAVTEVAPVTVLPSATNP